MRLGSSLRSLKALTGKRIQHLLPLMVFISITAYCFEGLAIYLIFPLLEILAGNGLANTTSGPLGWLGRFVVSIPAHNRVLIIVTAIVGCILIKSVISFLGTAIFANASHRVGDDIRRNSFAQVLEASPLYLATRPAGSMLNTISNQTWEVAKGLEEIARLIVNASAVLVFLVLLFTVSWKASITIFFGIGCAIVVAILVNRLITKVGRKAVSASEDMTVRLVEGLNGHTTLRLFNNLKRAKTDYNNSSGKARKIFYKLSLMTAVPQLVLEVLFAAVVGIALVVLQKENLNAVLVLVALLLRMQPHAIALVRARAVLASITGAVENLEELRDSSEATRERDGLPYAPTMKKGISLSHVSFSYPVHGSNIEAHSSPVLKDVSFEIKVGKVTALVGHSGAGKSTIAMLLCRLAEIDAGEILLDDVNLLDYEAESWRERCAFVPQDVFLFNDTLSHNIGLGRLTSTQEDIEKAARDANAHDFILGLDDGYDTVVGDRGENLSGGQRQRIALARALLRQPELLILDEATNALDPKSERLVSDALKLSSQSRTTLVIAHRLSTIERADFVVVLEEGCVVESGTPQTLMSNKQHFTRLFANEMDQK